MAGGEFRLGTDSISMTQDGHIGRLSTSLKFKKADPKIRAGGALAELDVLMRRSGRGSGHLGAEQDLVAEVIQTTDEALGGAVLVEAIEVVGSEIGEGSTALQHVEDGDQDLVADGHGRLLRSRTCPEPVKLVAQIAACFSGPAHRGGDQRRRMVRVESLHSAAPTPSAIRHWVH